MIVGIETGALTSATRCLLALGLAMRLLASSGDHPPAMVLHVHDIFHGLIHNGVLSCRGLSLLGSFRGSFPCCRWAELQQLAPTESASSLHCSVVARFRAHLYIVGCTRSRVSSSILRQAYLLAVCIWSNVEPPLLDRSLHADRRYLHRIIAKVITRHLGCSSPILGGERSSDGRQDLWAGERGRRVIQEPEDIGPSHKTTSTIKSHKPLCCIVLCGAGHYGAAFYAAGLRAAGLGREASQAEVCQTSDRII